MSVSYATVESETSDDLDSSIQDYVNQNTSQTQLFQSFISNNTNYPVMSTCDGPCKSAFPSNKLIELGRCDHYLCFSCFGKTRNSDGSFGCNSSICYREKEKEKAFETSSTFTSYANDDSDSSLDVSTYSSDCDNSICGEKNQMVLVKLVLIERNPYNATLRVHNEVEVASKVGARQIIENLLEEKHRESKHLLKIGRLYYLHDLKLRKLKNYQNYSLFNFPQVNNSICFVLDTIGYLKEQLVNISFDYE